MTYERARRVRFGMGDGGGEIMVHGGGGNHGGDECADGDADAGTSSAMAMKEMGMVPTSFASGPGKRK